MATRARALCDAREQMHARVRELDIDAEGLWSTRHHGDLHLGQVLLVDHDFQIVDFEGEVARPLAWRRRKHSPLRDVAGVLRSIDYAAQAARRARGGGDDVVGEVLASWREAVRQAFLAGYFDGAEGCRAVPSDAAGARALLELFVIEKALYEVGYELDHRPDWLVIPVEGLLEMVSGG